jgi:hypothetical protein
VWGHLRKREWSDGLGREMRVSALGDGEGIFEEIRVVEELRMVGRYTVVVGPSPRERMGRQRWHPRRW